MLQWVITSVILVISLGYTLYRVLKYFGKQKKDKVGEKRDKSCEGCSANCNDCQFFIEMSKIKKTDTIQSEGQ